MASLLNNKPKKGDTDYANNIANGVKYKTQEEAIIANAKVYAKLDWKTIDYLAQVLGIESDQALADALVQAKARIIRESIEKSNETKGMFD